MGHDDRSGGAQGFVAAGVIAVPVRVQNELHIRVTDRCHRSHDLLVQRGKLVVDQERAVLTDTESQVAARAHEHVDAGADFDRPDLHGVPVLLSSCRTGDKDDNKGEEASGTAHGGTPRDGEANSRQSTLRVP